MGVSFHHIASTIVGLYPLCFNWNFTGRSGTSCDLVAQSMNDDAKIMVSRVLYRRMLFYDVTNEL